jgi:hypothetical protein
MFAAAAEQGMVQAQNMMRSDGHAAGRAAALPATARRRPAAGR